MERSTIYAPLRIPRNKQGALWSVNLNQYRNTHYQSLNKLKKEYKELVKPQVAKLNPMEVIRLSIHIYAKDKRKFDVGNVSSIHEKFFLDALVELGKLPDDDYEHCPEVHTYFMGIDRENPRVEFIIEEIINVPN
ncbi:endodeoxyribonuclease [Vibrio phage vB_VhaP_PG11]|nr:endodeoxyribonuclease [Vibrio phage vB_VhaP_PG11]